MKCRVKLGNYLYAQSCPQCHAAIEQNQGDAAVAPTVRGRRTWAVRGFFQVVRFIES